jgi:hypothetical protein
MATMLSLAVRERYTSTWLVGLTCAAVRRTLSLLSGGGQSDLVMQNGRCGMIF